MWPMYNLNNTINWNYRNKPGYDRNYIQKNATNSPYPLLK